MHFLKVKFLDVLESYFSSLPQSRDHGLSPLDAENTDNLVHLTLTLWISPSYSCKPQSSSSTTGKYLRSHEPKG